jgi:hypothetical protein
MKKPMSDKNPVLVDTFDAMFPGLKEALKAGKCPCCSKPILGFKDALSAREYEISGMCQDCQDDVFNEDNMG